VLFHSKRADRSYRENLRFDITPAMDDDGLLNGQGREALRAMRFGLASVGRAGCESIAVFNALRLLSLSRPLPEIIRDMEQGGYMRLGGHLGAAPYFQPLLRRYGARTRAVSPRKLQRLADEGALSPGAVFLCSIWNDRLLPFKGLHTFTLLYAPDERGGWLAYNRFNSDKARRRYDSLRGVLRNGNATGAYLVIYRVEPLEPQDASPPA